MARRDTILLLVLIAVIFVMAALVGSGTNAERTSGDPRPSTYLLSDDGLQALYWTLEEMEVPVDRRIDSWVEGDTLPRVLAVMGAMEPPTPAEVHALLENVRQGGALIFASGPYDFGGPMYDSLGLVPDWLEGQTPFEEGKSAKPRPHRWTEGMKRVPGFTRGFADTSAVLRGRGTRVLLQADDGPVAVTFKMGRGLVLALGDTRPLNNARMEESGAAVLFARAAAEMRGGEGAVVFDEYHHGFTGEGSPVDGLWAFITRTGPGHAALHVAAAMLVLLLASARRFGEPVPPPPMRRRSPLEHVEALAGAYRQAGARRTVRRLLVAGLARRLGRRAPPDEPAAGEMVDRLARTSPAEKQAAAALETEWKRGRDTDLVALARHVDGVLDEVRRT